MAATDVVPVALLRPIAPTAPACSRRGVLALAGAGAAGGGWLVAACGAPGTTQQPGTALSDAPVTIQFYKRGTINDADLEVMLREWNQKHPTWKVQLTQGMSPEKLTTVVAVGDPIDLLGWHQSARTLAILMGIPRPIDEYVKRDRYPLQQFSAKEIDLIGRHGGTLYALPYAYGGNLTSFIYNRGLFREAGVPEPPADWGQAWTWDQFRDAARRMTKRQGGTVTQLGITQFGDPITSLPVLTDAKWLSDDYKKALADTPENQQTFERWAEVVLKDGGTLASPGVDVGTTSADTAFISGKAAMHTFCCGPADRTSRLAGTGIDWAFMPMPKIKYASPDIQSNITMPIKSGQHPEHSWELMKYLIENNRWGAAEKRVPAVLEDAPKYAREAFKDLPNVRSQVIADGIKLARPVDKIKYHPFSDEMYTTVVAPALAEIWAGKVTVRQTFPSLQQRLQAICDKTPTG